MTVRSNSTTTKSVPAIRRVIVTLSLEAISCARAAMGRTSAGTESTTGDALRANRGPMLRVTMVPRGTVGPESLRVCVGDRGIDIAILRWTGAKCAGHSTSSPVRVSGFHFASV